MLKYLSYLFLSGSLLHSFSAFGAACCGGSSSNTALITGDDRAQLILSMSQGTIVKEVSAEGYWLTPEGSLNTTLYKIDFSHIIADRYQAGISIPFMQRSLEGRNGGQSNGLSDIQASCGYEFLPDWSYNPYRPKGTAYLSVTLPTGRSIRELDIPNAYEGRGRGLWSLGTGFVLNKTWATLDMSFTSEFHHSFEKTIENSQATGVIKPGNGVIFSGSLGYNYGDLRLGLLVQHSYEDAIDLTSVNGYESEGYAEQNTTLSGSVSFLFNEDWSGTLTYADQTLLGEPLNTSLAQTLSLSLEKHWLR